MSDDAKIEFSREKNVTVLSLAADYESLDGAGIAELLSTLLNTVQSIDPPLMVVDLSETNIFGSAFIEALFRAFNRLGTRDGAAFALCGLTPYCREVIDVTHLDRLWEIYESREQAIDALTKT